MLNFMEQLEAITSAEILMERKTQFGASLEIHKTQQLKNVHQLESLLA